jgi:hypothetical protein
MGILGFGIGEAVGGVAQGIGGVAQGAGNVALGVGTAFSKLAEVLVSPVNMMCNWAEEPLKRYEHERVEKTKDADVQREITRQVGVERALSDQRIKEETEIIRIIAEIEQLKKDKEFERMKEVSDAMMEYQKELTRVNVEAVEAIGSMRIDLQRKAYELIYEKTQQYKALQNESLKNAQEQLIQINSIPNLSESDKLILSSGVSAILASSINEAKRFIEQLNDDMQLISKDINLITSSGQNFIQRHLEQFQLIGLSGDTTNLIEQSDNKIINIEK